MLDRLTCADFEALVGTPFELDAGVAGPVPAELLEARAGASAGPRGGGFSLLFRAATADGLQQGTYSLAHPRLGRLDVFLVPVGHEAGGLLLEAVFN